MAILKVSSITARPIGQAVTLVIIYVETFKTDVIVFISYLGHNSFDVTLTDNCQ